MVSRDLVPIVERIAGQRGRGKPLQIALDDVTGTTEATAQPFYIKEDYRNAGSTICAEFTVTWTRLNSYLSATVSAGSPESSFMARASPASGGEIDPQKLTLEAVRACRALLETSCEPERAELLGL